jgi:hypothetical protein
MAQKNTNIPARLAETLHVNTAADTTNAGAGDNIFDGITDASKFYCWRIDGTLFGQPFFVKIQDTAGAYNNTTDPAWRLFCPANSVVTYLFPEGQSFTTGISYITTTTAASNAASQTDPSAAITVTVLGGT